MKTGTKMLMSMALMAMIAPATLKAQDAPKADSKPADSSSNSGGNSDRGGRGGRGSFDPAQYRERMEAQMKERLGVNDDEWKVLQPKLEKVLNARRNSGAFSMFGGGFRSRGGDDNNSDRQRSAVEQAQRDLSKTLENKDVSPDEIKAKLKTLREAREKAQEELKAAQKELKEVLTQRQEATLVNMNMLE